MARATSVMAASPAAPGAAPASAHSIENIRANYRRTATTPAGSLAARRGAAPALPMCKDERGVPLTQEELQAWLPTCTCAICTGRSQRKWLAGQIGESESEPPEAYSLLVEAPAAAGGKKGRRTSLGRGLFRKNSRGGTQEVLVCEAVANAARLAV